MFRKVVAASTLIGAATLVAAPAATAGPASCDVRVNNTIEKLLECVTVDGAVEHLEAFQAIADANGGTRASGTPGYDASVDYVVQTMEAAGYEVEVQPFSFPQFTELSPATLEQVTPVPTVYDYFASPSGFATMSYSGSGDVEAEAVAVDVIDPTGMPANTSTSACEPDDFAGFPSGSIAVVQRGSCSFAQKALNAEAAGAVGVVIFNEGQPGREVNFLGTLGGPGVTIPVVGSSYDIGMELGAGGVTAHLVVDALTEITETANVIAQSVSGSSDNVVMLGAHLDSVDEGPGINDNGSGTAGILEVAEQMAKVKVKNQVRFAWWGAEESGLLGSYEYVDGLSEEEVADISLYLNFDMIGSPNHIFGIYDGDGSDFGLAGPDGSADIERTFEEFFTSAGVPFQGTEFSGRSDYAAFIEMGIPAGGLFTGAEVLKTEAEVALYGGVAGEPYDACYHLACDTIDNVNLDALDVNVDAVAYATLQYAMSTESINGIRGKGNFSPKGLVDAE